jgi:hypothetical protein
MSSSSQRRPRAIDATRIAKFSERMGRAPYLKQQTPEALGALQKAEIEKWWPIIRSANTG